MRYVLSVVSKTEGNFNWQEAWGHLVVSPEAAAAQVRSGDLVSTSLPEPTAFLNALANRTDLEDVTVFVPAPRKGGAAIAQNKKLELRGTRPPRRLGQI